MAKFKTGVSDLATARPDLAEEWNYLWNGGVRPEQVDKDCDANAWWMCSKGHNWEAKVKDRVKSSKYDCPYCSGKLVDYGENDLETTYPGLAYDCWDFEKNDKRPWEVSVYSKEEAWWKCTKGHSFKKKICYMVRDKKCSVCNAPMED